MKKLFVIGNGFDLAHGLHTRYEDFHAYLKTAYPDAAEDDAYVPEFSVGPHGEEVCDDDEVVGYLMCLLSRTDGEKWSDFEGALGRLDFDEDFDTQPGLYDREGDRDWWHESYNNEDLAAQLANCVPYIPKLFSEWINLVQVKSACPRPQFEKLIGAEDVFLNFNYTRLLELIYKIPDARVCHIHGVQGGELIFGHGEGALFDKDHGSTYIGCENGLEAIHEALRKDTDGAIKRHGSFFWSLASGLEAIYSYGFSFSKVDEVYIKTICSLLDTSDTVWYLHTFDSAKSKHYKEVIVKCGFKGTFQTFDA